MSWGFVSSANSSIGINAQCGCFVISGYSYCPMILRGRVTECYSAMAVLMFCSPPVSSWRWPSWENTFVPVKKLWHLKSWEYFLRLVTKKGRPKQQGSNWCTELREQWLHDICHQSINKCKGQCCYLVPGSFPSWTKSKEQEFSKHLESTGLLFRWKNRVMVLGNRIFTIGWLKTPYLTVFKAHILC